MKHFPDTSLKARLCLLFLVLCGSGIAFAHQEDLGDVNPRVRIEGDQFVVYIRNNGEKKTYKSILSADGKFISKRKPSPPIKPIKPPAGVEVSVRGYDFFGEDAFYHIPEWRPKGGNLPSVQKFTDAGETRIKLKWGLKRVAIVHGGAATKDCFVVITSRKRAVGQGLRYEINSFSKTGKFLHSKLIGVPRRIYDSPRQSQMVVAGKYIYVAWMKDGGGEQTTLALARFDPKSGELEEREICAGHHNTHPSIGAIGDQMLIAFHRRVIGAKDGIAGVARVKTQCVSLKKTFAKGK